MSTPKGPVPNNKDVVYVDVDDEITTIIDKVRSSGQKIVALVLPKRATVMQSIVNMKLLKRSADDAKKHIVLISSEVGLLPLAGVVGVHVAKSLQSKPEVPMVPAHLRRPTDDESDEDGAEAPGKIADQPLDRARPVSEYAGAAALADDASEESIEMTDDTPEPDDKAGLTPAGKKPKKDRRLAIPDFNKFRWLLFGGGAALIALIIFFIFAVTVMPKATVLVKTDSEVIDTSMDVTLATDITTADLDEAKLPAKEQKVVKNGSETVPATGSLNKGEKATGEVKIINCSSTGDSLNIPAGTGVSSGGLTFVTKSAVNLVFGNKNCTDAPGFSSTVVDVTAIGQGSKYNIGPATFSVAGHSGGLKATSSEAMSGGTDLVVKVVQQTDIDNAAQKIAASDSDAIEFELQEALRKAGLYAMRDTFKAGDKPEVTTDVAVGAEAEQVIVTQKTTYTMLGVKQDDLKKLIADQVKGKIDKKTQVILDYGIDDAEFEALDQQAAATRVSMRVTTVAGSDLDLNELKAKVAGKKASAAQAALKAYPGVTEVEVKYSPFWVSSIPKKTSKITLTVEKPQVKNDNN